jgi:outer membrane immunogenic protein
MRKSGNCCGINTAEIGQEAYCSALTTLGAVAVEKLLLASVAALALMMGPAFAADMPVKAPPMAPVVAPTYSWTGFYVGGNMGYGWDPGDVLVSPGPQPAFGLPPFTTNTHRNGFIGGGQIGYNLQSGALVYGIEVDFSGADITGSVTDLTPGPPFGPPGSFQQVNERMDWFGTLRGRLGLTPSNNLMVYATGGLAAGRYSYSSLEFFPGVSYPATGNSINAGWTIGAGAEWAFLGNWSVKLEYLYYDFANTTVIGFQIPAGGPFFVSNGFENKGNIIRVGLNYRFGGR